MFALGITLAMRGLHSPRRYSSPLITKVTESASAAARGGGPPGPGRKFPPPYVVHVVANFARNLRIQGNNTAVVTVRDFVIDDIELGADHPEIPSRQLEGDHVPRIDMTPAERDTLKRAESQMKTLSITLEMPGADVVQPPEKLRNSTVTFLIRPKENKGSELKGRFILHGSPRDMEFTLDNLGLGITVQEHYSLVESINWSYTILGSGFTLTGIVSFLVSRYRKK